MKRIGHRKEDWKLFPQGLARRVSVASPLLRSCFNEKSNFHSFLRRFIPSIFDPVDLIKVRSIYFGSLFICDRFLRSKVLEESVKIRSCAAALFGKFGALIKLENATLKNPSKIIFIGAFSPKVLSIER